KAKESEHGEGAGKRPHGSAEGDSAPSGPPKDGKYKAGGFDASNPSDALGALLQKMMKEMKDNSPYVIARVEQPVPVGIGMHGGPRYTFTIMKREDYNALYSSASDHTGGGRGGSGRHDRDKHKRRDEEKERKRHDEEERERKEREERERREEEERKRKEEERRRKDEEERKRREEEERKHREAERKRLEDKEGPGGTGKPDLDHGSTPHEHRYARDPDTGELIDFEWVTTRAINPVTDKDLLENAAKYKGKLSNTVLKSGKGNFSYTKVDLDIELPKKEYYAHSQVEKHSGNPNIKDISELPDDPIFEATTAPNGLGIETLRVDDTEYKILNEIAKYLGKNTGAKGKITLFTEKDTCGSCNYIISQFKKEYKNIQIEVIHNQGNAIVPIK
ncbi:hypothetical protein C8Z91_21905, partial [Paenibacillus elgii]